MFHYSDIGLIQPAFISEKGYRYYHVLQYDTFLTIKQLREIGMPLSEIKEYINNRTPEKMIQLYQEQEYLLEKQIEQLQMIKKSLFIQRKSVQQALRCPVGKCIQFYQDTRTLLCSETIRDASNCEMTKKVSNLIYSLRPGYQIATLGLVTNDWDMTQPAQYSFKFYIDADVKSQPKSIILPAGECICLYHHGDYESLPETFMCLKKYATARNLNLNNEIYAETVIGEWAVKNPNNYVIKVFAMYK